MENDIWVSHLKPPQCIAVLISNYLGMYVKMVRLRGKYHSEEQLRVVFIYAAKPCQNSSVM